MFCPTVTRAASPRSCHGALARRLSLLFLLLFVSSSAANVLKPLQRAKAAASSAAGALRPIQRFKDAVSSHLPPPSPSRQRAKRLPCFAEFLDRAWPGVTGTYGDAFDITSVKQFRQHKMFKTTVKGKKKEGVQPFSKAKWFDHLILDVSIASKPECSYLNDVRALDGEFLLGKGSQRVEYVDCPGHGTVAKTTQRVSVDEFLKGAQFRNVEFCRDDPPVPKVKDQTTQTEPSPTRRFQDQGTQTEKKKTLRQNARQHLDDYMWKLKRLMPGRRKNPSSAWDSASSSRKDSPNKSAKTARSSKERSLNKNKTPAQPTTSLPLQPAEDVFAKMAPKRPMRHIKASSAGGGPVSPVERVEWAKMRPKSPSSDGSGSDSESRAAPQFAKMTPKRPSPVTVPQFAKMKPKGPSPVSVPSPSPSQSVSRSVKPDPSPARRKALTPSTSSSSFSRMGPTQPTTSSPSSPRDRRMSEALDKNRKKTEERSRLSFPYTKQEMKGYLSKVKRLKPGKMASRLWQPGQRAWRD
ncbi:hypothetical protein CDD80_4713 [Ophiocordyceps camponoti-rufipedis]|uniref:Uncharacterized protein n=1 Tax=Ophiocordyceps camponoti-rufipedis TaxID=2004952 RepID=A0A2C5ZHK1_9HYPO|nr:hypothetical protein CDD80_4713 [Ophiocordyceps camponoti-rufipedis]